MTHTEFQSHMGRLVSQFGKAAYSPERALLVWNEVNNLPVESFKRMIDKFIGEFRQPPLLNEFREEVSREREVLHRIEKDKNHNDAQAFMKGTYQPDDVRTLCQFIVRRMGGDVTDSDYSHFVKQLKDTVQPQNLTVIDGCKWCHQGIMFVRHKETGATEVFRCRCRAGMSEGRQYPRWQPNFIDHYEVGT